MPVHRGVLLLHLLPAAQLEPAASAALQRGQPKVWAEPAFTLGRPRGHHSALSDEKCGMGNQIRPHRLKPCERPLVNKIVFFHVGAPWDDSGGRGKRRKRGKDEATETGALSAPPPPPFAS